MDPVPQNIPTPPEVPAPVPQVEIPVPVPIPTPTKPSNNRNKIVIGITIAILLILVSTATAYYFFVFKNKTGNSGVLPEAKVTNLQLPKYWINCNDKRQVIEEENLLYIGCLGGVLIIDKTTGEVKDQISMANGMGDVIAESIVKKGDVLYIGTQDGISVFNLKTREAKKISVKEGLVNGANVELSEDGDNIWAATFDGVSLLNTVSGKLTNYTTELDSQSEKRDISNVLATDKYVYFLEVASAYSSGAVIRYDKSARTFKIFKPDSFGRTDQYARLDFNTIAASGNQVFVSDDREIFTIEETPDSTWKKIDSPSKFILKDLSTDFSVVRLLRNNNSAGILMFSGSKIYRYIPAADTTEIFYDFGKVSPNIIYSSSGSKLWFSFYNRTDNFVNSLDLTTKQIVNFQLKDRPELFGQIVALIDDEPIVDTSAGINKYSLDQGKFVELLGGLSGYNGNFQQPVFQPIPGTSEIFVFRQVCGQGCEKPAFDLYNYADGTDKELILPSAISTLGSTEVPGGIIYDSFSLSWRDFTNGKIGLDYPDNGIEKYIVYDINSGEWSGATRIPEGVDKFDPVTGVICNRVYAYKINGNKFSEDGCTGQATSGNLSWKINDNKIVETDKATGKTKTLTPPVLEANYTPFDTVAYPGFGKLMFAHSKLWIASNRGLISYDPNTESYKLYGPSEGLLSKDITDYLVGKYLWVVTNMGGLSVISE